MCRWFAYIGLENCLLEDVLITPKHSLTKQVTEHYLPKILPHVGTPDELAKKQHEIDARNKFFNIDGVGVAWYSTTREEFGEGDGPRPCVYKTIQPPLNDGNFTALCAHTSTTCLFAHIRMATSVVSQNNNHPFVFGRHIFMHNGVIMHFEKLRRPMCHSMSDEAFETIKGTTDSEHIAALYFTYLGGFQQIYPLSEMKSAMERTLTTIMQLQKDHFSPADYATRFSSLNLATTDGVQFLSTRFTTSPVSDPPSLYISTSAGITLNRKFPGHPNGVTDRVSIKSADEHAAHVIVASEPTTYDDNEWDLIGKNEMVMVDATGNVERVPADVKLEA